MSVTGSRIVHIMASAQSVLAVSSMPWASLAPSRWDLFAKLKGKGAKGQRRSVAHADDNTGDSVTPRLDS
jgi:hypothetical protein